MNDSLREILITDLPPAFVTRFQEAATWAYQEAWERVRNDTLITDDGRQQLMPGLRRVLLEAKLQGIALDSGLRAESEKVSSGAYRYVAVRAGRLVLTCSKTSGRNAVPRTCEFRGQYSDINEHIDQQSLFPVCSSPGRESVYCIIIHGPDARNKGDIGLCCFGFPSTDMQTWVQEPIALADIHDYQQLRYRKNEDDRAQIQQVEPQLKPEFGATDATEKSA